MAYPPRSTVFARPKGFHATPRRGSPAVQSILTPALELVLGPATINCPLAGLKFARRLAASVIGVTNAHANPRFRVRLLLTFQVSSTNGRYNFQRRPVIPPPNSWSWRAIKAFPVIRSAAASPVAVPAITQNPFGNPTASVFNWFARKEPPTRIS